MSRVNELIKKQVTLEFNYLPDYADFLLHNKLTEFGDAMLKVSREEQIPILKFFETMPEEQITKIIVESSKEILNLFSQNKARQFIEISQKKWVDNQLPYLLQTEHIIAEDITMLSFIRRKIFRQFLPEYTSDITVWFNIMEDLDRFTTAQEENSIETLVGLNKSKLQDNHYFLEKINNTSPGIVYVFDIQTYKRIYLNKNVKQLLGFADDEVKKMDESLWFSLLHPEDLTTVIEYLKAFSSSKDNEVRTVEYRVKNNHNTYVWLRQYDTVFKRDAENTPTQIIGIAIDVTNEKETINQLKLREQEFHEAQEIAGFGVFEWDLQGNESTFSPQLMKIFDLEQSGNFMDFLEFIHPADQQKLKKALSDSMNQNGLYECQYRYKNKNAKVVWSRGLVTFENGKPLKMRGFVMDVTKNYLLSEMLMESETTFRQLIQNAPDAVVVVDAASNIVFWNPKAESLFGWKSEDVIGKTLFNSVLSVGNSGIGTNWWQESGQSGTNKTIEITTKNKKGKEVIVALSVAPSSWNGKQAYITFIRNISNEKKIEKELEQNRNQLAHKNEELEQINSELTSFNYIASHDLKEPLRKIKTYGNFIVERSSDTLSEDVKEYMKRIMTATSNMQKLIDDLLAFSRTSSTEKNLEETDLNILLEEVKGVLRYTIDEHEVTISSAQLPVVRVIPFQFQQLMENIIGNAIKYRKSGTKPSVSITYEEVSGQDYISSGAIPSMDYNKISVADNGIGFNQIYAHKIFEIFQRLHGKHEYSGTGIGLAICKKIVENHKGFITADGIEGKGATFHIFIPMRCPDSEKNKEIRG